MTPVELMKALADETRLTSLVLLLDGPKCVCDLMDILALSQPKVSRHLALLRDAGLVTTERRGQWIFYSIADSLPEWALVTIHALKSPMLTMTSFPINANAQGAQPSCC